MRTHSMVRGGHIGKGYGTYGFGHTRDVLRQMNGFILRIYQSYYLPKDYREIYVRSLRKSTRSESINLKI